MQQIADATGTLCLQPADDGTAREQGLCQKIAYDIDQNANALIQDNVSRCCIPSIPHFNVTVQSLPSYDIKASDGITLICQTDAEDLGNSNSLDYFGLSAILPKPAPLGV